MDKHRALFRPSMMVHGGMERVHVLFKRRCGGVELEGERQQVRQLPVLRVGNSHVFTYWIHSRIEDVVLDVLVDLQLGGEGAHQVPAPRVMGWCCFDCLEQPPDQFPASSYAKPCTTQACTRTRHGAWCGQSVGCQSLSWISRRRRFSRASSAGDFTPR